MITMYTQIIKRTGHIIKPIEHVFSGNIRFGASTSMVIVRNGDEICDFICKIILPEIRKYYEFLDGVENIIIDKVRIVGRWYGNTKISRRLSFCYK